MPGKSLSVEMALRKARALASQGDRAEAAQVCRAVLARFPSNRRALALLETLRMAAPGRPGVGVGGGELRAELEALVALHRQGRAGELQQRAAALARRFPDNPVIPNLLGATLAATGHSREAIASYERALEIDPKFLPAMTNLGVELARQGRDEEAVARHRAALEVKPDYAEAHYNLGNALRRLDRPEEAAASYARALEISPGFLDAHRKLGATLRRLGRDAEAVGHYRKALELAPNDAETWNSLGVALSTLGEYEEAIASYREALERRPDLREAYTNLCELYEKTNRIDELRRMVALDADGAGRGDLYHAYWSAELAAKEGLHQDARDVLEGIPPERLPLKMRLKRAQLLGRTYDRLGQFSQAFSQFAESNRLAAEWQSFRDHDRSRYIGELVQLTRSWSEAPEVDCRALAPTGPDVSLAFLVGFPRSGTTLLDTVLLGHPKIAVLEERPTIERVRQALGQLPTFEVLDALDADDLRRLRSAYLEEASLHLGGLPREGVIVDKLPLNLANAGLIHRLFPQAKFILALRHPCDCVLSCFIQNFRLNDAMASFLDLEHAAELYDLAMRLWKDYRSKLGLDVTHVRYEELVVDLRTAIEPLLEFVGLDWDDSLLDYRQSALSRGRIDTPSYNQVTQDLYTHARGRWDNYRPQMASVLPVLGPWAAEWGYSV